MPQCFLPLPELGLGNARFHALEEVIHINTAAQVNCAGNKDPGEARISTHKGGIELNT